jgi:hypothetical protein
VTENTAAVVDNKRAVANNNYLPTVRGNNCLFVALGSRPSHGDRVDGAPNHIHAIPSHYRGQPQRTKTIRQRPTVGSNKSFSSCHNSYTVIVNAIKGILA